MPSTAMKCRAVNCANVQRTKAVLCASCWNKLPIALKETVRQGTSKGEHSLRAKPSNSWVENANKYVGRIRITTNFVPSEKKGNNNNKGKKNEKATGR